MVDFAAHNARAIARLGQSVSITPAGQAARAVVGIFTAQPAVAFGLADGYAPTLRLTTADAAGLANGDPVTVAGVAYTVNRQRHDSVAGDVLIDLDQSA